MAFESLTEKLQNVFKNLRSKGRLTEEDVKVALKEVKMALLEADVNFKAVYQDGRRESCWCRCHEWLKSRTDGDQNRK